MSEKFAARAFVGHTEEVTGVAWSPTGDRLVSSSADGTARIWDAATGRPLVRLEGHSDRVEGVAWSPDGGRIATAGRDKVARLWDAATGQSLLELRGDSNWVTSVAFGSDGTRLVTGCWDGTVSIWDANGGSSVQVVTTQVANVTNVGFDAERKRIVLKFPAGVTAVFDAHTGKACDEPAPAVVAAEGWELPDGRLVISQRDRLVIADPRASHEEMGCRRWAMWSNPYFHAARAEQHKADPFATAVQRSLEQRARGQLAAEDLDFDKAQKHFLAALLLKPKPYQWPEVAPPPRLLK